MINLRPAALCGAMLLIAANSFAAGRAADEGGFRVLHYEPVLARALQKPVRLAGQSIRFQALGRDFHLQLEDNNRLLAGLSKNRREKILQHTEILRGRLDQVPGSWVRLTRTNGDMRGLIWDGQEMFAVGPGAEVALSSTTPTVIQTYGPVIFRWADTENMFSDIVRAHPRLEELNTERQLEFLTAELGEKAMLHGGPDHFRLDIAALGDFEYANVLGNIAESGIIDRVNSVDGIFESQLGVQINLAELRLFDVAADDPFGTTFADTSDASKLIDDVACYKCGASDNCEIPQFPFSSSCNDPVLSSLGLVHLFTGITLDMPTVGIAFSGAVCNRLFGVSLTQAINGPNPNYLVTAHEIGHNFNAPHDGAVGDACESTPDNLFLMGPQFNRVDQFSACSIQEMQAFMTTVSCLTLLGPADMAVTIANTSVSELAGGAFDYSVQVDNIGQTDASTPSLTLTVDPALTIGNIRMPGFSCPMASPLVCSALQLNNGGSATLTVAITGMTPGNFNVSAVVDSDNDIDLGNNMQNGTIEILPAADLQVSVVATDSFMRPGENNGITFSTANLGPQAATNTQLIIDLGSLLTVTAGSLDPACTTADGQNLTCRLGTVGSGVQQNIVQPVTAGPSIGSSTVTASVGSDLADGDMSGNADNATVRIASRLVDLRPTIGALPTGVRQGQSSGFSVTLENLGPDTASQPEIDIVAGGTGLAFTTVTANIGSCTFTNRAATCAATDLAGVQTVSVSFDALSAGNFQISATTRTMIAGDADIDPANDSDSQTITLLNASTTGGGGGSSGFPLLGLLLLLAGRRSFKIMQNRPA